MAVFRIAERLWSSHEFRSWMETCYGSPSSWHTVEHDRVEERCSTRLVMRFSQFSLRISFWVFVCLTVSRGPRSDCCGIEGVRHPRGHGFVHVWVNWVTRDLTAHNGRFGSCSYSGACGSSGEPEVIVSISLGHSVLFKLRRRASESAPSEVVSEHGDLQFVWMV